MHPQGIPEMNKRLAGAGGLTNVIGNPLETTIFLSHLIFDGTLDKFPALKVCAAHAGGYLPSYAGRSDYGCNRFPEQCKSKKHASEYLRQLYFDTMVFTTEGVRHLVAECGASQLMIGTDYPFPWSNTIVDDILEDPRPQRRRQACDPGRERSKLAEDQILGVIVPACTHLNQIHRRKTEVQRLRRMSEDGRHLGPPAPVPHLRPRRLLRFFQEQTRHQTLSRHQASHREIVRARRRLGLVLYR